MTPTGPEAPHATEYPAVAEGLVILEGRPRAAVREQRAVFLLELFGELTLAPPAVASTFRPTPHTSRAKLEVLA